MADVLSNHDVRTERFADPGSCSGAKKKKKKGNKTAAAVSVASTCNTVFHRINTVG